MSPGRELAFYAAWVVFWVSVIGLVSAFTVGPLWVAQYLTVTMAVGLAGLVWVWGLRSEWRNTPAEQGILDKDLPRIHYCQRTH